MTQALNASVNTNFENHAPGKLYLFPYPSSDPGGGTPTNTTRLTGLLALLYGTDTSFRTPTGSPTPTAWGDIDENGLELNIDIDFLEFPHNDGGVPGTKPGSVKSCQATFTIFDCDAAHWADVFGCQAADLITINAASGKAGRQAALLGFPNSTLKWTAILAMQSALFGEFDHLILPRVNFLTKPKIKYSVKDKLTLQVVLGCNGDLYMSTAASVPVFSIVTTANAVALA